LLLHSPSPSQLIIITITITITTTIITTTITIANHSPPPLLLPSSNQGCPTPFIPSARKGSGCHRAASSRVRARLSFLVCAVGSELRSNAEHTQKNQLKSTIYKEND
jgi:hypothetical protein